MKAGDKVIYKDQIDTIEYAHVTPWDNVHKLKNHGYVREENLVLYEGE